MPSISRIRLTNVVYEDGNKRYNDEVFIFDGHNGAIILENGGGKTVFIQTALQAVLPHHDMAGRKIKDTLTLTGTPAHIAIEWILSDSPRRYVLTAVTLFMTNNELDSYRYVYEYTEGDNHALKNVPFVKEANGKKRPAGKDEIHDYYLYMSNQYMNARTFSTLKDYYAYLAESYQIVASEWRKIAVINGAEGGVDKFFDNCNTTGQLVDQLLIPTVEDAILGTRSADFADTFEKNRDHFKQSKLLRMQIEESQQVEQQIHHYHQVFAEYDTASQSFEREKKRTKFLYQLASNEQEQVAQELEYIRMQKSTTEIASRKVRRQKRSREIVIDQRKLAQLSEQYQERARLVDEQENALQDTEHERYTFEYAKYRLRKREAEDNQKFVQERLAELDGAVDFAQLRAQLEQVSRTIKGYYVRAEVEFNHELTILQEKAKTAQTSLEHLQQAAERVNKEKNVALQEHAKRSALEAAAKEQMTRIANNILYNPLQETVEDMLPKWKLQIEDSLKHQQLYRQQVTESSEEKTKRQAVRKEQEASLHQERERLHEWKHRVETVETSQRKILHDFITLYPRFSFLDSLYAKEASVVQILFESIAALQNDKEQLLRKERMATRMSDEYEESDFFMSEPELQTWVERWRDQFDYLVAGTQFLQDACRSTGKTEQELYDLYPYWSATIITTEGGMTRLADRLDEVADRLRFPVLLANNREMNSLSGAVPFLADKERQILPKSWRNNLSQQRFEEWKASLKVTANEASRLRTEKERELQSWLRLQEQVQTFFHEYPHELYQEWRQYWHRSKDTVESLEKTIQESDRQIKIYEDTWQLYSGKLQEEKEAHTMLSHRVQAANDYLIQKQELEKAQNRQRLLNEQIRGFEAEVHKLNNNEQLLLNQIAEIKPRIDEYQQLLYQLQGEELYRKLKNLSPLATPASIDTLRSQYDDLTGRLREQQAGRDQLENQLRDCDRDLRRAESDMNQVQSKAQRLIDIDAEYPLDGEERLLWLGQQIKKMVGERKTLQLQVNELNNEFIAKKSQIENDLKHFTKQEFPGEELDQFDDDLDTVQERLLLEEQQFNQKMQLILQEEQRLTKVHDQLRETCDMLKLKNERFQFNHPSLEALELSEKEQLDFPYARIKTVQERLSALETAEGKQALQFTKLNSAKEAFRQFCQQKIQDVRLRDKAISGIENKRAYREVEEWAQRMSASIMSGIRILEEDLRGHDDQMQHFIVQMHDHLKKVASELTVIPRKTSVKVEDYWKAIYAFTVPEWKEELGKQALRGHIDWMLAQLDSDQFKDTEGKDDLGKIKKWIFTTLQTKQLLHIVMGSNAIKVKCRKVSNDGKVSGALASWEESNKWSGGEKWSKNMTLFLGLLNYLSEKHRRVERKGLRTRTVIMDNPFGQASSEHVLDPVFFIADQLGFQIITLTALAEGKFIRDYFPIVYSCRLRESVGGNTSIMTKQKEIKQAYFHDHDPVALERLTEHEQLSLFPL